MQSIIDVSQREAVSENMMKIKKSNITENLQKQQYLLPRISISYLSLFYNIV
jgi:hypothetical protein